MVIVGLGLFGVVQGRLYASVGVTNAVEQWDVFELEFKGPTNGNPFVDVRLFAEFDNGAKKVEVAGFYDGDGVYRVRFMPDTQGKWRYCTRANCWELTGKTGEFIVTPPSANNHGPVRVHNTYHFAYADGTPYKPIGTTIYNWLDTPEELQEETLRTLAESPFNKARMLITPQRTPYRNEYAPPRWPYVGTPPNNWDFKRFNPEFFRHWEKRIKQLRELGIEADLILFHPYGRWGFEKMTPDEDALYVRYVVARFSAFRNVWWSLANEFDFLRTKTEADWDRLGALLQQCDPYNHLRSIHNGYLMYDHRKAWVTHASIQDGLAVTVPGPAFIYRRAFQKPVIFDEVEYEGDGKFRWADLTGPEMVHRFWCGVVSGTYVGHGDYFNTIDEDTWTSFGGKILGTSVPRIAFLRKILEDGPADGLDPIDPGHNPNTAGVPGEYYLIYFGAAKDTNWFFQLPKRGLVDGMKFTTDVVDTWEMSITRVPGEFVVKQKDRYSFVDAQGRSVQLPGKPGIALRIRRVGDVATKVEQEKPVEEN